MFNWKDFLDRKVAVQCDSLELAKDFLKNCEEKGIRWCSGEKTTSLNRWIDANTTYTIYMGCLRSSSKGLNNSSNFKIVKWEKQDEYLNALEILKFGNGSKFEMITPGGIKENVEIKECRVYSTDWNSYITLHRNILEWKFKPVAKKEPINFIEAIKEYANGKTIYCETESGDKYAEYINKGGKYSKLEDNKGFPISLREILSYKWFIKEN